MMEYLNKNAESHGISPFEEAVAAPNHSRQGSASTTTARIGKEDMEDILVELKDGSGADEQVVEQDDDSSEVEEEDEGN